MKFAGRKIENILRYLDTLERMARSRNDRTSILHYGDCWRLVAETFFGNALVFRRPLEMPIMEPNAPLRALRFPLAPLRKVLTRKLKKGCIYYALGCGHDLQDWLARIEDPIPRYKRCPQCAGITRKAGAA